MVSIRSDDIRGRWGRLIDNTVSFTNLDLSGQSSGITAAISGQVLAGNISGQVSGFAVGPTNLVPALTNSAFLFSFAGSGGSQSFRFTPANDSGAINISVMDANANERIFIQRAASGLNIAANRMTTSGVLKPIVFQMVDSVAATTQEGMRIDTSSNVILNRSGGTTLAGAGINISGVALIRNDIVLPTNPYAAPVSGSMYFDASGFNSLYVNNGASGFIMASRRPSYDFIIHKPIGTQVIPSQTNLIVGTKWDGTIIASGTNCQNVIQSIFDSAQSGSHIYIADGIYWNTGTFTGFTLGNISGGNNSQVTIELAPNAELRPAAGFSGVFFKFTDGCIGCTLQGGRIREPGAAQKRWTAIQLESYTQDGCQLNTVRDIRIDVCKIGIELSQVSGAGSQGFVNGNYFDNIKIITAQIGINFNQGEPLIDGQNSMNRNHFNNVIYEANFASGTSGGVVGVVGRANMFVGCKMWDLPSSGQSQLTILSGATNTQVYGGLFLLNNLVDLGRNTNIIDQSGYVQMTSGRFHALDVRTLKVSGFNYLGVFTSGGVSGGSGASFSGMIPQGYINMQVSGNTVKVPFFN